LLKFDWKSPRLQQSLSGPAAGPFIIKLNRFGWSSQQKIVNYNVVIKSYHYLDHAMGYVCTLLYKCCWHEVPSEARPTCLRKLYSTKLPAKWYSCHDVPLQTWNTVLVV
jgi:amino acid permease